MRHRIRWTPSVILLLLMTLASGHSPEGAAASTPELSAVRIPFVENFGQTDPEAAFYARTLGGTLFITKSGELVLALSSSGEPTTRGWVVRETLEGAKIQSIVGTHPSPTRVSSFIGGDPGKWQANLPTYNHIRFGEIYDNVELELRAYGGTVEKVFRVRPGGTPWDIRVKTHGGDRLRVTDDGQLALRTPGGDVRFSKPIAFQVVDGAERSIDVAYRLDGNSYGFEVGPYDRARELVIDPVLSTYLGGSGADQAYAVGTGSAEVYVAGATTSADFPGVAHRTSTDKSAFVARFTADLTTLQAATYLGGEGADEVRALAVHPSTGQVFVTGMTDSDDFADPAGSGTAPGRGGGTDAFLARLNSDLTGLKSLYVGGQAYDAAFAVKLRTGSDPIPEAVYIAGYTESPDLPGTTGAFQEGHTGPFTSFDAFVSRVGTDLVGAQSTYLGGSGADRAFGLDIHPSSPHDVYVAGETSYAPTGSLYVGDFPGIADQNSFHGENDAFVAILSTDLAALEAATYVGGPRIEFGMAVAVHPTSGNVYLAGGTICEGENLAPPLAGDWLDPGDGPDPNCGGGEDAFAARLDADLNLLSATYLGGNRLDRAHALVIHPETETVYVAGRTRSANFMEQTAGGLTGGDQVVYGGGSSDVFVARLQTPFNAIQQATFVGGSDWDELYGPGLAVGVNSGTSRTQVYVAGGTSSTDFPAVTAGSAQSTTAGPTDAFVAGLNSSLTALAFEPDIEVTPADLRLDFGSVTVGDPDPPTLRVTITNRGGSPLNVAGIALSPSDTMHYSAPLGGGGELCPATPFPLSVGTSCAVDVTFSPQSIDTFPASLRITSNSPGEEEIALLLFGDGVGEGPRIRGRWEIHTVDTGTQSVDIALEDGDSTPNDQRVHLCYFTPATATGGPTLRYATGQPALGDGWTTTDLDFFTTVGSDCEIAVAADGSVHVAYVAEDQLRYRRQVAGIWEPVQVVETSTVDANCALAVFGGLPYDVRIAYRRYEDGAFIRQGAPHLARSVIDPPGHWAKVTADESGPGRALWIRFLEPTGQLTYNSSDQVDDHVILRDLDAGTRWALEDVPGRSHRGVARGPCPGPGGGAAIRFAGIEPDLSRSPVIIQDYLPSASDAPIRIPMLLREIDLVDGDPADQRLTMDLDRSVCGNVGVHLVFHSFGSRPGLRYLHLPDGVDPLEVRGVVGLNWPIQTTEIVDLGLGVGQAAEIITDGSDRPHIGYLDADSETLKYAQRSAASGALASLSPHQWEAEALVVAYRVFVLTNTGTEDLAVENMGFLFDGPDAEQEALAWSFAKDEWCHLDPDSGELASWDDPLPPGSSGALCVIYSPILFPNSSGKLIVETSVGTLTADVFGQQLEGNLVLDSDGDGVPDHFEGRGRDDTTTEDDRDGNEDGVPDYLQDNVASLLSGGEEGSYDVTIVARQEGSALARPILRDVEAMTVSEAERESGGSPPSGSLPYGILSFAIIDPDGTPGGRYHVDLHLDPDGPRVDNYYKYGPTPEAFRDDIPGPWYEFWMPNLDDQAAPFRILGAGYESDERETANILTLTIQDGSLGDRDLAENGVIVDPGAPVVAAEGGSGGGGGGCFVEMARERR